MKINRYIGFTVLAASMMITTSCSDWNDWNEVQADPTPSADKTLWDNLSSNTELANFKTILDRMNMQETFKASKFYTIWAPTITDAQRDSILALDSTVILEQFINNHVAEFNYQATGILYSRIHTLNNKAYSFAGSNSDYMFNNIKLSQMNIPNSNGTLHILDGQSPFLPNAYQNIWMTSDMDSLANYVKAYEISTIDESRSVPGPIVNGKQTYIDTVWVTSNTIMRDIRAELDNEDSVYTFLMPNNEAYKKMYNTIKSLYKYKESTQAQDVANATASTYTTITGTSNVDYLNYLADSLIRRQIINNLAYSHTNRFNKAYFEEGSLVLDTIQSTYRRKFSEPDIIFDEDHIVETKALSNGNAVVVDSLGFKSWETYNPERDMSGLMACRYLNGTAESIVVNSPDSSMVDLTNVSKFTFAQVTPSSSFSKPELDYYLYNVLSGTYRIYVVIPPASVNLEDTTTTVLPNWLNFTLNYYNGSKLVDYAFKNERYDPNNNFVITYSDKGKEVKTTVTDTDFFNDTTKVDTMLLGEFTFPYCYSGLDGVYPNIKVTVSPRFSTLKSKGHITAFDRTLRINAIIMRPVEYDKYLKEEE